LTEKALSGARSRASLEKTYDKVAEHAELLRAVLNAREKLAAQEYACEQSLELRRRAVRAAEANAKAAGLSLDADA
jgi:hypothetical protein